MSTYNQFITSVDSGLLLADRPRLSFRIKRLVKRVTIFFLAAMVVIGGWLGYQLYSTAAKTAGDKNPLSLLSVFKPVSLDQTKGRTNILLTGYSADDPGHQGADLTDSIIVISIDKSTNSADIISIPRDTYVDIPGFGYQKINAAYEDGGMSLMEKVINQDLGITINYYTLINYAAVQDAVNDVGGVTVNIDSSDPRGLYDPNTGVDLPNGTVKLDGQQALDLSRARGDDYGSYGFPNGDFDRIKNQQLLLLALKAKISSSSVIANPLKVGALIGSIGNNIKTNLQIDQFETLYSITKNISNSNIKTVSLNDINGQTLLTSYVTDDGEDALIPTSGLDNYSQIQTAVQNLLSN
jgi:LCP family protein required for cell wall assembly